MAGLNYHSQDVVPYLLAIWALLVINTVLRSITTRITTASITPLIGAKSTLVNFPSLNRGFTPGQHVRVRLLVPSLWSSALESHPFTIASAEGHSVNLIVKAAGDWTNSLYDLSLSNKQMRCTIEGPYGGPLNFLFPAFRSVMIIVGGSGSKSI
jgi:ferric-chelate reductase